jgi:hypothetical protein
MERQIRNSGHAAVITITIAGLGRAATIARQGVHTYLPSRIAWYRNEYDAPDTNCRADQSGRDQAVSAFYAPVAGTRALRHRGRVQRDERLRVQRRRRLIRPHLKGSAGTVAKHDQVTQQTKPQHFGWFGHGKPLTRATSAAVAAANRAPACPKGKYPNPNTCDEYPYAATYQGTAFFPASNSSAPVSAKENSAEGAFRVAMYRTERLFNKDSYWVFVVP